MLQTIPIILVMNSERSPLSHEQTDATYYLSGDKQKIIDTFEQQLELLPYLKLTRVIVLGQPSLIQFAFLKHLVLLLRKKHEIEDVFIQCNTEPNGTTWGIESHGFTMMYKRDNIRGARPTIWSKINTSSVVIAPSVPSHVLYQAFKFSGIGLLICADINNIVADLRAQKFAKPIGGILDFFDRVRDSGYKIRMPLLEGGDSWCAETSIHRVGKGRLVEPTISSSQGWTMMGNGRLLNKWSQYREHALVGEALDVRHVPASKWCMQALSFKGIPDQCEDFKVDKGLGSTPGPGQ